jgi:hypothetical protein
MLIPCHMILHLQCPGSVCVLSLCVYAKISMGVGMSMGIAGVGETVGIQRKRKRLRQSNFGPDANYSL